MNTLSTALSGLQAAQTRMDTAANNLANAQTEGYRREQVTAVAEADGGVRVQVEKVPEPGADLAADLVEQKAAAYSWQANLQTVKTVESTVGSLLSVRG